MTRRIGLVALLVSVAVLSAGLGHTSATTGNVEQRIAEFWRRIDAMQPGDHVSSGDLGQWAQNVIERDSRARLTVADFRESTAAMQSAIVRAGPADAGVTPSPTPTPTVLRLKVGQSVTYKNGWKLTVIRWEEQAPDRYSTLSPGMRLVTVIVRFDNAGTSADSFNRFDFKLQDGGGVRRGPSGGFDRNDRLGSGELAPGAFVSGSLTFEAPIGDQRLQLIYEATFRYQQATWELY